MPTDLDTKTTDSEGKATLSAVLNNVGIETLEVIETSTGTATQFLIKVVECDRIDMSVSSDTVTLGNAVTLTSQFYALGQPVPNLAVTIDGNKFKTDANGIVKYNYTGTGGGEHTITAETAQFSQSITVHDAFHYMNIKKGIEQLQYYTINDIYIAKQRNGIQIASGTGYGSAAGWTLEQTPTFVIDQSMTECEHWVMEFDVISVTSGTEIIAGTKLVDANRMKTKPTVKYELTPTTSKLYINGGLISETSRQLQVREAIPAIYIRGNMTMDNIKLYQVVE